MRHPAAYKPQIARVALVHNHTKDSAALAWRAKEEIEASRLNVPVVFLSTQEGGSEDNAAYFEDKLEAGDVVAGIFGDGSILRYLKALKLMRDSDLRKLPFISLAGGNARDFGQATHRNMNAAPSHLLQASVAIGARMLAWSAKYQDEVRLDEAVSYIGHGETALGSYRMDSDEYRDRPQGMHRDWDLGMASIRSDLRFRATDCNGKKMNISDLTVNKGSRMAKLGRFSVDYWDPDFQVHTIGPSKREKWMAAGRMMIGHAPVQEVDSYSFKTHRAIPVHFDGEPPIYVEPDTEIEIGLGAEYVLMTTRLHLPS